MSVVRCFVALLALPGCAGIAQQRELVAARNDLSDALERVRGLEVELEAARRDTASEDDLREQLAMVIKQLGEAQRQVVEVDLARANAEAKAKELEERTRVAELEAATSKSRLAMKCVPEGDARTAAACAASRVCSEQGRCGHVRDFGCAPTRDSHCRRSKFCSYLGACHLAMGGKYCVAESEDDCRSSIACRTEGRCSLVGLECK